MTRQSVRIAALQAITVLLMTLPFIAAGAYIWDKHLWAQTKLSELEPRHARLQGLSVIKPQLDAAVTQSRAWLAKQAYPATLDATQAGNDAQQRIRAVFAESQLNVESIQVIEAKDSDQLQRVGVVLRAEGTLPAMQAALLRIRTQSPTILVDSFSLQSTGVVKPASTQRVSGSFNFSVLRLRS